MTDPANESSAFRTSDAGGTLKINRSGNTVETCASVTGSVSSPAINGGFEARG